jgi:hypothetical protein
MMKPVLMLNAAYEAVRIVSVKRSMTLLTKGKAVVEVPTDREIYPGIFMPSVIRLTVYRKVPHCMQVLSRKNIYLRDSRTCQYCGLPFGDNRLTLDHVIPQAQGGKSTWDNLVCACQSCNHRKADRTPEQWVGDGGWPLLRKPKPLTVFTSRGLVRTMGLETPEWRKYLYYENDTPQEVVLA